MWNMITDKHIEKSRNRERFQHDLTLRSYKKNNGKYLLSKAINTHDLINNSFIEQ